MAAKWWIFPDPIGSHLRGNVQYLVAFRVWRMGQAPMVSTQATAVGGERCLFD